MCFSGKTAFITGASSGMGLSCALLLLARGANVVSFDLKEPPPQEDRAAHRRHLTIKGDVSRADDVRHSIQQTVETFGRLDIAINCAGITGALLPMLEQADDALENVYAVNMRGIFLAMKYEAEELRKAGGGAIVNFASVYSKGSHERFCLYGSTKHAVVGLTEGAAVELAKYNIRVNAVAPGPILTPFIGVVTPEIEEAVVRGIPQQRIGRPEEVARAVLWLASDEASYVTGATLTVDGGQAARLAGL